MFNSTQEPWYFHFWKNLYAWVKTFFCKIHILSKSKRNIEQLLAGIAFSRDTSVISRDDCDVTRCMWWMNARIWISIELRILYHPRPPPKKLSPPEYSFPWQIFRKNFSFHQLFKLWNKVHELNFEDTLSRSFYSRL